MKVDIQYIVSDLSAVRFQGRILHYKIWTGGNPPRWGLKDNTGVLRVRTFELSDVQLDALKQASVMVKNTEIIPIPKSVSDRITTYRAVNRIGERPLVEGDM